MAPATALSRLASSHTIMGSLPPSSRVTLFIPLAASSDILFPVPDSPVKEIFLTSGLRTRLSPAISPEPVTTFRTPAGRPASFRIEARVRFVRGVLLAGFSTKVLPEIRAGAIFHPIIRAGMFQGMMAVHTPRGFFTVKE